MTVTAPQIDILGGSRLEVFRYQILDTSGNVLGELNPVVTDDGSGAAPTVRTSVQGNSNRVLRMQVTASDAAGLDAAAMRVRPEWVDTDGTVYPFGVFRVLDASVAQFSGGDRIDLTCGSEDSMHHTPNPRALTFGRGYSVAQAIDVLAGILNIADVDADATTADVGEPLAYPVGSADWYDIYTAVAAAGGMLPPFFTLDGTWRWRTVPIWGSAPPDHIYSTDVDAPQIEQKVVQQTLTTSVTFLSSPNVWYAVNTAAKNARIVGSYRLPANAPNSVERTGAEVAELVEVASLASEAAADNAARAAAANALDDIGTASFATPVDARHELYDTVEVDGLLYREVGTQARLFAGEPMSHECRRVYLSTDPGGDYLGGLA